jgi:hypothetical protein
MTNREMAKRSRKAIEAFNRLPPEEQVKRLIASGTIDEHGKVLLGDGDGHPGVNNTSESPKKDASGPKGASHNGS